MADARQYLKIDGQFEMVRGEITEPSIAYETWGTLNEAGDNAVLILTGLSPSAHAASSTTDHSTGWWEDMVGPSKPIDTNRFFVICVNSLGSCFGSTGPASINPESGEKYRLDFPVLCLEDVAKAGHLVVKSLGVDVLHTVVGNSMGGMTALAYTLLFPGKSQRLVSTSSAARSAPFSIALRSLQRELIRKDAGWKDGHYAEDEPPATGMLMARKLGMITYRSAKEWEQRFGRERATDDISSGKSGPFGIDFEIESYLEAHGRSFINAFDANCYLYLSRAMDLFDASDHGGSIETALALTGLESALVIGVETDFLFPPHQQKELATGLEAGGVNVTFEILDSLQGHDSFLIDMDRFRPVIGEFFGDS
ncbi:MAG: homoserine O-acetyltransferase [Rhodospirillaceae bacterium]|nr:homoserine O-acetyltransferase [Rhodospirillaceae bacterium]|tara:strand:+ start:11895 stop:12995 length:1101 start_codon:yes stop_codon:yes gene_type:complete